MKTEGLNEIARILHKRAKEKGFWDEPRETGTLLMLIVSELAEALEADRKGRHECVEQLEINVRMGGEFQANFKAHVKDTFEDEIADVFIRLFDLVGYMDIDIEKHIGLKMRYNREREYKHGKAY